MQTRILIRTAIAALGAMLILLGSIPRLVVAEEEFPQKNAWSRVTPSIAWCGDPQSTMTIEVHIVGRNDVAQVQVTNVSEQDRLTLYDDGTHGDGKASDNVFTLSGARLSCNPSAMWGYGGMIQVWHGYLRVTLKDGRKVGNNYGAAAALVNPRLKNVFQVKDFGNGLSATTYAFFIHDSRHEVFDNYPVANVVCGKANFEAFRKMYGVLPDAFDFAVVTPGEQIFRPSDLAENVPYQVQVSNAVQRIGLPLMNDTAKFSSAGRLKSVAYHSFGSIDILDHEMAHTWGAGIGASLGIIEEGQAGRYHWNKMSDIGGQLGAYYFASDGKVGHFRYNGDNTWRLVRNSEVEQYMPLELYVMGLLPPEQVPPIHILTSPDLSNPERITAASVRTVTIEEIVRAEGGPREPSAAKSQKDFTLAYIVTQDRPYNDAAYAFFSIMSLRLMSRDAPAGITSYGAFYWATGGRATLNTRLSVGLPEPTIPSAQVTATPVPRTPTAPVVTRILPTAPMPTRVPPTAVPPIATPTFPPAPTVIPFPTPPPALPILPCLSGVIPFALCLFLLRRLM